MTAVVRAFPGNRAAMSLPPPATTSPPAYVRKWARPMPRQRPNIIPPSSWLAYNNYDKDPELEFVLSAIEQSGRSLEWIEAECERIGHRVRVATLLAWFYKSTRYPKSVTMGTVMAAIGWERNWRQVG